MKSLRILILPVLILLLASCKPANLILACDKAQFIDHVIVDVPLEQGGVLMPGTHFTKAWEVQNAGGCDWTLDYALVQISGPDLGADKTVMLQSKIVAGDSGQLSLSLTAPSEAGSYKAEWMLQDAAGKQFGTGPDGDRPLTLEFVVPQLPNGVIYDFAQSVCLARWDSNRATFLPCDGQDDDQGLQDGYVRVNQSPALEGSTRNNPPVIEVKPNNQSGGFIIGYFPPITIQEGDRFAATIGCMDANPGCKVIFELDYMLPDGTRAELAEWPQVSDDQKEDVNLSLTDLAGEEVTLMLIVKENGGRSAQAKAFWLDARIEQGR